MSYEIQKACLIPISVGAGWRGDHSETTEVWMTVAQSLVKDQAEQKLNRFLEYNKGKEIFYRIVKAENAVKS